MSRASLFDLIAGVASFLPDDPNASDIDGDSQFAEIEMAGGFVIIRTNADLIDIELRAEAEVRKDGRVSLEVPEIHHLLDGVASLSDGLVNLSAIYHTPVGSPLFVDDLDWLERSEEDVRLIQKFKADSQSAGEDEDRRMEALREYSRAYQRTRNATLHLRTSRESYGLNVSTRREKFEFDLKETMPASLSTEQSSWRGKLGRWSVRAQDLKELVQRTAHAVAKAPNPRSTSLIHFLLLEFEPDTLRLTGTNGHILARAHAPTVGPAEARMILSPGQLLKFVALLGSDDIVVVSTYEHNSYVWFSGSRVRVKMWKFGPSDDYPPCDDKFPTAVLHEGVCDRLSSLAVVREVAAAGTGRIRLKIEDGKADVGAWPSDLGASRFTTNTSVFAPHLLLSQLEHAGGDRLVIQVCPCPPSVKSSARMCVIRSSNPVKWVGLVMPLRCMNE
jgi:hypothetical protein